MSMSDFPLLAITDATSCSCPLAEQIEHIAMLSKLKPDALILRAKTLSKADYRTLSIIAQKICTTHQLPLILHSDWQLAQELKITKLHLPLPLLRQLPKEKRTYFTWLSTSVHSVSETQEAKKLGASVLIAGHIYATQCKADLAPRGLDFLRAVTSATNLPVYAIGGIGFDVLQHAELKANGARGACVMSAYMRL